MERKHTPGPWAWRDGWKKIDAHGRMDQNYAADREKHLSLELASSSGLIVLPLRIDHHEVTYDGDPISPADRALISAAPDLLAACEAAHVLIDLLKRSQAVVGYPREWSVVDNTLRAAIAKATGEQA